MKASRVAVFVVALGAPGLLALSCASSDEMKAFGPFDPAPSADRAAARAEREARQKVRDEQKGKDAGVAEAPVPEPPPPEPPPEPIPEPAVSVVEAPVPATPSASASVTVDAGPPPVASDLCSRVCERVVACTKETLAGIPGAPGIGLDALKNLSTDCIDRCAKKSGSDPGKAKDAEVCLKSKDCTAFMACIDKLDGDDDDGGD